MCTALRFTALALAALTFASIGCSRSSNALLATADAFEAAEARGDLETARALLTDDPRVWYGERRGEGSPWSLGGGRWKNWDEHFNGTSERGEWRVEPRRVTAVVIEMNDYFRLCEAGPSPWTRTYFFAPDGRIEGTMISSAPKHVPSDRGRRDEFDAWLQRTHPDEYDDLRPDGDIDPTGDRPQRTRALLHEWRAEVGLPAIE